MTELCAPAVKTARSHCWSVLCRSFPAARTRARRNSVEIYLQIARPATIPDRPWARIQRRGARWREWTARSIESMSRVFFSPPVERAVEATRTEIPLLDTGAPSFGRGARGQERRLTPLPNRRSARAARITSHCRIACTFRHGAPLPTRCHDDEIRVDLRRIHGVLLGYRVTMSLARDGCSLRRKVATTRPGRPTGMSADRNNVSLAGKAFEVLFPFDITGADIDQMPRAVDRVRGYGPYVKVRWWGFVGSRRPARLLTRSVVGFGRESPGGASWGRTLDGTIVDMRGGLRLIQELSHVARCSSVHPADGPARLLRAWRSTATSRGCILARLIENCARCAARPTTTPRSTAVPRRPRSGRAGCPAKASTRSARASGILAVHSAPGHGRRPFRPTEKRERGVPQPAVEEGSHLNEASRQQDFYTVNALP